jgi:hypothetical protein
VYYGGYDEKHYEHAKQQASHFHRNSCNASKTEDRRYQSNDQKSHCPLKHGVFLSLLFRSVSNTPRAGIVPLLKGQRPVANCRKWHNPGGRRPAGFDFALNRRNAILSAGHIYDRHSAQ